MHDRGLLAALPTWALVTAGLVILAMAGFAVWTWLGPRTGGRPKR